MLSEKFGRALASTAHLHNNQCRKGGEIPYASHLLGVCAIVLDYGGAEAEAIAALLHDSIEDQLMEEGQDAEPGKRTLTREVGPDVTKIVCECSDAFENPKPDWFPRKLAYIRAVPHKSPSAILVSAADKLYNARAILRDYRRGGDEFFSRFNPDAGKDGTLWYYTELVAAFREAGTHPELVDELDRVVTELVKECGWSRPRGTEFQNAKERKYAPLS